MSFKIVKINYKYCDFLREFDNKIAYNAGRKELRPFIGVLFKVSEFEYFAPLSSPKPKHLLLSNSIDLIKINDGKYGVINLNNMIPVYYNNYEILDLNNPTDIFEKKYFSLVKKQLRWLNSNKEDIVSNAIRLYNLYKNDKLAKRVKIRCCNYPLLEEKCFEYNNETVNI